MEDLRVLVVDDEHDFLDLFVKRFRRRGLVVDACDNGPEALRKLAGGPVDVVVLDVLMPGMDGIETLREIKKRHPDVEVIMLTGHGSVESGIQGMSYGAYDYIMKPFKIDDLHDRIRKAGERREMLLARRRG